MPVQLKTVVQITGGTVEGRKDKAGSCSNESISEASTEMRVEIDWLKTGTLNE